MIYIIKKIEILLTFLTEFLLAKTRKYKFKDFKNNF